MEFEAREIGIRETSEICAPVIVALCHEEELGTARRLGAIKLRSNTDYWLLLLFGRPSRTPRLLRASDAAGEACSLLFIKSITLLTNNNNNNNIHNYSSIIYLPCRILYHCSAS